jgi:hypothetical protein
MAFDLIGKARGVKVPDTEGQRDWVDMFREATKTGGIKAGQAKAWGAFGRNEHLCCRH